MEKLGMGSALSVGRASHNPCKFIVMHYRGGGAKERPIVLVGKGLTFDTGGISLKPGDDLDMMKYDMAGGASVLGAMKTVARLGLPLNLIGIVGAVENMPGGNASRPGSSSSSISAARKSRSRWCWWAKASPSTPAASRSSRASTWTR